MTYSPPLTRRLFPSRAWTREVGVVLAGAALIAALAQVSVDSWPVPLTGQTLGVLLAGGWLGFRGGVAAVGAYLAAAACGLPVLSGGAGGPQHLLGPTGGYMIGFVVAAGTAGLLAEHGGLRTHARALLTMVVALLPVYVIGLAWLSFHVPVDEVAAAGLWPFLPGEAAKVGLAVLLTARSVR